MSELLSKALLLPERLLNFMTHAATGVNDVATSLNNIIYRAIY